MNTNTSLESRVLACIRDQACVDQVELSQTLIDDLKMDSLDVVELMICIEEEFDIDLSNAEGEDPIWTTVEDVIATVRSFQ